MNTKHMSLPWEARGALIESEGKVFVIAEARAFPHSEGVTEANAAFIVRAANSHDQLVAALKMALEIGDGCSRGFLGEFQAAARAALAAAES